MESKHVLSADQFSLSCLVRLYQKTEKISSLLKNRQGRLLLKQVMNGRTMGLIFYQPSTRTFHHFSLAGFFLGASVGAERGVARDLPNGKVEWDLVFSSQMKGEYPEDLVRALGRYDVLVLRHHQQGFVERMADILDAFGYATHVINGGDGDGEHPSQAVVDLFTIFQCLGCVERPDFERLSSTSIAFIGDSFMGRTVHSLARLLGPLGVLMRFVSPRVLSLPEACRREFAERGFRCEYLERIDDLTPGETMFVYNTRIQVADYVWEDRAHITKLAEEYMLTQEVVRRLRFLAVMHPFPRRKELPIWLPDDPDTHEISIDRMPEAQYFRQMDLGPVVRAALLWDLVAPEIGIQDLEEAQWAESFTKQCMCGKVFSTILGWAERPQPYSRYLPKVASCPYCGPRRDGQIIHV